MTGVYVHIPFCRRRCLYCDFYSVGERLASWPGFVDALLDEAQRRLPEFVSAKSVASQKAGGDFTLYIGGGTPSLMPHDEFTRLSRGLLTLYGTPAEFTLEVNPDDVTREKVSAWRADGVTRVSMGVQSFVDSELRAIGRRHDSQTARRAFQMLRGEFDNISLDLMFGLPGQTVASLEQSVTELIALGPEHVSVYSLMYEERTAITRLRDSGKLSETPEEDSAQMFSLVNESLRGAGYERYEISNYSRPGFRSRHNSLYWQGNPYIGLGPGAHSYNGNRTRLYNLPDIKAWLAGAPGQEERLSDEELREEMIMTRLRTAEGLNLGEYGVRFGNGALKSLLKSAAPWLASGELEWGGNRGGLSEKKAASSFDVQEQTDGTCLALTTSGVMISDEIIVSLF